MIAPLLFSMISPNRLAEATPTADPAFLDVMAAVEVDAIIELPLPEVGLPVETEENAEAGVTSSKHQASSRPPDQGRDTGTLVKEDSEEVQSAIEPDVGQPDSMQPFDITPAVTSRAVETNLRLANFQEPKWITAPIVYDRSYKEPEEARGGPPLSIAPKHPETARKPIEATATEDSQTHNVSSQATREVPSPRQITTVSAEKPCPPTTATKEIVPALATPKRAHPSTVSNDKLEQVMPQSDAMVVPSPFRNTPESPILEEPHQETTNFDPLHAGLMRKADLSFQTPAPKLATVTAESPAIQNQPNAATSIEVEGWHQSFAPSKTIQNTQIETAALHSGTSLETHPQSGVFLPPEPPKPTQVRPGKTEVSTRVTQRDSPTPSIEFSPREVKTTSKSQPTDVAQPQQTSAEGIAKPNLPYPSKEVALFHRYSDVPASKQPNVTIHENRSLAQDNINSPDRAQFQDRQPSVPSGTTDSLGNRQPMPARPETVPHQVDPEPVPAWIPAKDFEDRPVAIKVTEIPATGSTPDRPEFTHAQFPVAQIAPAPTTPIVPQQAANKLTSPLSEIVINAGSETVEVRLDPEELGSVTLHIAKQDERIAISIGTDRPETQDLLRRHIQTLEDDLLACGYRDVSFDFGGRRHAQHTQGEVSTESSQDGAPSPPSSPQNPSENGLNILL